MSQAKVSNHILGASFAGAKTDDFVATGSMPMSTRLFRVLNFLPRGTKAW
jgi:hypothetical protein